mmetsp:Transcript_12029/g.17935  ORF Transcript_12029/g.17935 Transcript_12029/m.17935 type:complete len:477 (-) Transcript_12029:1678-3108(-)
MFQPALTICIILLSCSMYQQTHAWAGRDAGGNRVNMMKRNTIINGELRMAPLLTRNNYLFDRDLSPAQHGGRSSSLRMSMSPIPPTSQGTSLLSDLTDILPFNPEIFSQIESSNLISVAKYLEPDEVIPPLWLPALEDKVYLFLKTPAPYIRQYNPPVGNAIYDFAATTASSIDFTVMSAIKLYGESNAVLAGSDIYVWYREDVLYATVAGLASFLAKYVDPKLGYIAYDTVAKITTLPPVAVVGGSLVVAGGILWIWNAITKEPEEVIDDGNKQDAMVKEQQEQSLGDLSSGVTATTTTSDDDKLFEEMKKTLSKLQSEVDGIQTSSPGVYSLPIIEASVSSLTRNVPKSEEYNDAVLLDISKNSDILSQEVLPTIPSSSYRVRLENAMQILQDLSNDIAMSEVLAYNRRSQSVRNILNSLELDDNNGESSSITVEQSNIVSPSVESSGVKALPPSSAEIIDFETFLKTHTKVKK